MLLQIEQINKQFGEMYALKDVSMDVRAGEVHGLVGENGAGKSTLIKILTGVYSLGSGEIFWNDKVISIESPHQSRSFGISVIHQDRHLVPAFNGVENAYLGLPYVQKGWKVDWDKMRRRVQDVMDTYGIEVNLDLPAFALSPPERTMLEIVRAMMVDCKLLILDEPTAALTDKETAALFAIIDRLREKGTSCLYVTHRMDEIFRLTDRITVLKNGTLVATVNTGDVDKDSLISMMTDDWESQNLKIKEQFGDSLLSTEHLSSKDGIVKDASLNVHAGEILGVFGLGGSGRTELLECLYGYRPIGGGKLTVKGKDVKRPSARESLDNGVVLICEDRRGMALVPTLNVKQNIVLSTIANYSGPLGIIKEKQELADASQQMKSLNIKAESPQQAVMQLSGGNQQKVVFAKALLSDPQVLLCDEPTQAVDVKTRAEIHKLLRDLADAGNAVVFVSSDLKEVLEVADNIQIFAGGQTKKRLVNKNLSAEEVLAYCYAD